MRFCVTDSSEIVSEIINLLFYQLNAGRAYKYELVEKNPAEMSRGKLSYPIKANVSLKEKKSPSVIKKLLAEQSFQGAVNIFSFFL